MPTNNEINRRIAEFMGLCWHHSDSQEWCCEKMMQERPKNRLALMYSNPDYCSPDSPRRLLDEVVAKLSRTHRLAFIQTLADETHVRLAAHCEPYSDATFDKYALFQLTTASPERIATAIYNVLTNGEEGKDEH